MMNNNLEDIQKVIGYTFSDERLLTQALTHISFANDNKVESYERLEFLGDAVIELVVSDYIFNHINIDAGASTKLRSALVSTENLSSVTKELGLDKLCYKSKSLQFLSKKNTADLFESLVGAVYVDGGIDNAKDIIHKFVIVDDSHVGYVIKNSIDYKSSLQEYMQGKNIDFEYKVIETIGPDHLREFEVALVVRGESFTTAKATSIQQAEEMCAKQYLNQLN